MRAVYLTTGMTPFSTTNSKAHILKHLGFILSSLKGTRVKNILKTLQ